MRRPRSPEVYAGPLTKLFGWAVAIGLALYFLEAVTLVALGFLAAASLAAAMRPVRDRIPGPHVLTSVLAGVVPVLVFLGLLALIGWFAAGPMQEQLGQWPELEQKLDRQLAQWGQAIGIQDPPTVREMGSRLRAIFVREGSSWIESTAKGGATVMVALALLFFGCLYLLTEREGRLLSPALDLLPAHRRPQVRAAVHDLEPRLRWWVIGTFASMVIVGVAAGLGFWAVGLAMALPLAVLAGASEIVPTVGPAAVFLVAVLVGWTQGTGTALGVAILYSAIQALESYILVPLIMRQAVRIPPVVTLFTVILWGQVFGPAGLLLAIPINLALWSFADRLLRGPRMEAEAARARVEQELAAAGR